MAEHWGQADLDKAVQRGLLKGDPSGDLRPDDFIKRVEAVIIDNRVYDRTRTTPDIIAPKVEPAVLMVVNERDGTLGSGVSIGGGYLVTNAHVVLNLDDTLNPMYGMRWSTGEMLYAMGPVVAIDRAIDLAILYAAIGDARLLMPRLELAQRLPIKGEPVSVFGSPVGLIGSVSHGVVSGVGRYITYMVGQNRVTLREAIQTDAPINPGNSGGALVNQAGELLGIPSVKLAHLAYEGLGFCIGLAEIQAILNQAKLSYIPQFSRPDYEGSPDGWEVSVRTHYLPLENVTHVVFHHTGDTSGDRDTSALEINHHHRTKKTPPWDGGGYHFVVRKSGLVELMRPLNCKGAHVGAAMNACSWSVVMSGNFEMAHPTEEQVQSVRWLWRYLSGIKAGLLPSGHRDHGDTECPGRNVRVSNLIEK